MDRIESLGNTLSQITMYDIKSMYNQAKNVVLNVSEMEAKVREATNDEPWGASSTLMQDIAQGTFSFQYFNEIMPCIYARFMEKEARQWRQIYKALQLLEYLIKHGSERVVDDARSHISTLKMLRNFHYIDDKGKDEGINVRNRSRELVELLSDVEKIRGERRKAKANKHKYTGTGNDGFGGGMSFSGGGGRYGGFGSDSLGGGGGGYNNSDYGSYGAGSSGGGGGSSFRDESRRGGFEEYNAGDDEVASTPTSPQSQSRNSGRNVPTRKVTAPPPPAPAPVEDLLGGFGDDDAFGSSTTATTTNTGLGGLAMNKELPAVSKPAVTIDDDDFADFQAAPVQQATTGNNVAAVPKPSLMDMLGSAPAPPPTNQGNFGFGQVQQPTQPNMTMGGGMGMGGIGGMHRSTQSMSSQPPQYSSPSLFGGPMKPTSPVNSSFSSMSPRPVASTTPQPKPAASANFDDLWSMSLGGAPKPAAGTASGTGKSIKDLEREKAMAGLWGGQKPAGSSNANTGAGAGAFGSFGNSGPSGGDDLLL